MQPRRDLVGQSKTPFDVERSSVDDGVDSRLIVWSAAPLYGRNGIRVEKHDVLLG